MWLVTGPAAWQPGLVATKRVSAVCLCQSLAHGGSAWLRLRRVQQSVIPRRTDSFKLDPAAPHGV